MCEIYVICLGPTPFVCNVMLCETQTSKCKHRHFTNSLAQQGKYIDKSVRFKRWNCILYRFWR